MKFCIVGAGAIGGWTGAWLAQAGHEVALIARGAHLRALRANGLTLVSQDKRVRLRLAASDDPGDFGAQDFVFLCLKTYAIGAMLPRITPLVGASTVVVPAINGLPWWYFYKEGGTSDGNALECLDPGGKMLAALDPKHVVGCVVHGGAEVTEPGVVAHTGGNRFILGEPDRTRSERVQRLAAAMAAAGFDAPVSTDIRLDIWTKLVGNLSYNPIAALTLARMGDINGNERLLDVIRRMIEESMRVAEAYGVRIPVSVEERIAIARKLGNSKISMHQDVERRRPLEIDAIVGSVMELGRKAGIATPMTGAIHALVTERARHLDG